MPGLRNNVPIARDAQTFCCKNIRLSSPPPSNFFLKNVINKNIKYCFEKNIKTLILLFTCLVQKSTLYASSYSLSYNFESKVLHKCLQMLHITYMQKITK